MVSRHRVITVFRASLRGCRRRPGQIGTPARRTVKKNPIPRKYTPPASPAKGASHMSTTTRQDLRHPRFPLRSRDPRLAVGVPKEPVPSALRDILWSRRLRARGAAFSARPISATSRRLETDSSLRETSAAFQSGTSFREYGKHARPHARRRSSARFYLPFGFPPMGGPRSAAYDGDRVLARARGGRSTAR